MLSIRRSSRLEGKHGDVQGPVEHFRALIFALPIPPLLNFDELVRLLRAFSLSRNYRERLAFWSSALECVEITENFNNYLRGNLFRKRIEEFIARFN